MLTVLNVTAMLISGLVAGVFFDVAIAMMPAFFDMRPGSYVEANNMIGGHYHPTMPIVVNIATISDLLLGIMSHSAARQVLFFTAFAFLVGVQLVSQFGNVPINKRMLAIDRLIHVFHCELVQDPVRSVGVNLIYGKNTREVTEFLDRLTYGEATSPELKETKVAWDRKQELSQRYHPINRPESST